ncbi:hypothetical protein V6N12_043110 [Hibiscus sabdariffa]|uniref:Uncharacterized protein n=1 Tax=Hibiscus sabdariffa TaxID=183260 RepID=A0ABR2DJ90_9ROSI
MEEEKLVKGKWGIKQKKNKATVTIKESVNLGIHQWLNSFTFCCISTENNFWAMEFFWERLTIRKISLLAPASGTQGV